MTLIAKGGDKWEFQAEAGRDPLTGRRRRHSKTFVGSKRQAERAHALFLAEQRPSGDRVTLAQLLDKWFAMKTDLSPTTRQEYQRLIGTRIKPALGHVELRRLTAADLDRFYQALMEEK